MAVRKREWKNREGETQSAWVAEYFDHSGKRRLKTFEKKKDADAFLSRAKVEVRDGSHTADAATTTIAKAGELWLVSCQQRGRERTTIDSYRQALIFHINPYLGRLKLSQLSAPVVRQFEDDLLSGNPPPSAKEGTPRSTAMVKKVRAALSMMIGDATERGLVNRNVVRELRSRRKAGNERKTDRRQKGKLKIGVDIPTTDEIRRIIQALEEMQP